MLKSLANPGGFLREASGQLKAGGRTPGLQWSEPCTQGPPHPGGSDEESCQGAVEEIYPAMMQTTSVGGATAVERASIVALAAELAIADAAAVEPASIDAQAVVLASSGVKDMELASIDACAVELASTGAEFVTVEFSGVRGASSGAAGFDTLDGKRCVLKGRRRRGRLGRGLAALGSRGRVAVDWGGDAPPVRRCRAGG